MCVINKAIPSSIVEIAGTYMGCNHLGHPVPLLLIQNGQHVEAKDAMDLNHFNQLFSRRPYPVTTQNPFKNNLQLGPNFAMVSVSMVVLTSIVVIGFLIYIISKRRVILDYFSQIPRYFVFRGPRTAAINAQS